MDFSSLLFSSACASSTFAPSTTNKIGAMGAVSAMVPAYFSMTVVLLYVIAACVRSNKRYCNPLEYRIFACSCTYILYCKVRCVTVMSVQLTVA